MSKTSKKTCLFHASQPSGSELLKWGIPPFRNFKMEGSIRFSNFLKEMSSYYQCFSSTSRDSQILNCIEEFSMFAVYVKYWTINHFWHSYKQRHLLAICLSDPSISEFPIWRDPSIWEFLFGGIPHFRNSDKNTFFEGFCLFFVLLFAFSPTICMWNAVIAKQNWFIWPSLAVGAPIAKFRGV